METFKEFLQKKMQVQDVAHNLLGINLALVIQTLKQMAPQHTDKIGPNTLMPPAAVDKLAQRLGISNYSLASRGVDNWTG